MPVWQKGQSGNPVGRPPRGRALTEILRNAGEEPVLFQGKEIPGKEVVAALIWQVVTTGKAELPGGRTLVVGAKSWLEVVKFLYGQLDGPPSRDVNVNDGAPITLVVGGLDPNEDI